MTLTRRRSCRDICTLLVLPMLLIGCATVSPSSQESATAVAAARAYYSVIELGGRLSVRYQQNGSEQAVHGGFNWSQNGEHTAVTLLSPLGQTMATLNVMPNRATLIQSGHPPRTATDVDSLVLEAFGWPFPVSGLRDWLQGFAVAADNRRFIATPASQASVTTQDGWQIHYPVWQDQGDLAISRPRRIDLARETMESGAVAIRLVIDTWQPR